MNGAAYLIIGLVIGLGVGLVIGALRLNSERGKVTLLNSQIDAMREEENRLTTLNEQLRAVTTGMAQLTTQTQEAELKRTRAESEMRTQIENMKLGNETLLRETTKLAGALSNSQTRGKYGEAQLETLLENAGLLENVHFLNKIIEQLVLKFRNQISKSQCLVEAKSSSTQSFPLIASLKQSSRRIPLSELV